MINTPVGHQPFWFGRFNACNIISLNKIRFVAWRTKSAVVIYFLKKFGERLQKFFDRQDSTKLKLAGDCRDDKLYD